MRRKGFTLVELLVVIAIIALLMGILMPALARVRQLAFRMTCGTNLSGIGKAMLIYANDYNDELPRAGNRGATWGRTTWNAANRVQAYNVTGNTSTASVSSSFYLLIKYAEVTPKSFVCKSDTGTRDWSIADEPQYIAGMELIDAWDFGGTPEQFCSYTYHYPFGMFALSTTSEPGMAVAADRNPYISSPANPDATTQAAATFADFNPAGGTDIVRLGNAITHQQDGQNVMFLDTHVEFARTPACSVEEDNIYTRALTGSTRGDPKGSAPASFGVAPVNRRDSLLVHDPPATGQTKGRTCFPGDTVVWVDGGMQPIANVAAGQAVGLNQVEQLQVHPGTWTQVTDVVLENGECITVIGSHLFRLASGQFVQVQQLRQGSELDTMDGTVKVAWTVARTSPYVGTVYNVKVQDADEYFVGKTGVVVRDF